MERLKGFLILLAGIMLGRTQQDRHMCREMARLTIIGWLRPYRVSFVALFVGEIPEKSRQDIPTGEYFSGHMELIHESESIPSQGMRIALPITSDADQAFEVEKVFYGRSIHDRKNWGVYDAIVIVSPATPSGGHDRSQQAGLKLLERADQKNGGLWLVWWKKSHHAHRNPLTEQEIQTSLGISCHPCTAS